MNKIGQELSYIKFVKELAQKHPLPWLPWVTHTLFKAKALQQEQSYLCLIVQRTQDRNRYFHF
jgi:hypothetical protein